MTLKVTNWQGDSLSHLSLIFGSLQGFELAAIISDIRLKFQSKIFLKRLKGCLCTNIHDQKVLQQKNTSERTVFSNPLTYITF